MKKILPNGPLIALCGGMAAMLLRFWFLLDGVDESGLYPRFHIAWILVCVLAAAMTLFFLLLSRQTDRQRPYEENFPASAIAATAYLAAALGIGIVSLRGFLAASDLWGRLTHSLGLVCCGLLAWGGYLRLKGKPLPGLIHALPTLFFALRMFLIGKRMSADPETALFLFRFLASMATTLACYQLWGFSAEAGDRRKSCFWSLTAGFLCLTAAPGAEDLLLYAGVALWLLLDICSLQPPVLAPEGEEIPQAATPQEQDEP